ncbi:MAG: signal peptide peptidase SppA [Bdellovibrionales bacterium]|nr:signal peptide peptidase SppA [Bdellovibrionales bacterium]
MLHERQSSGWLYKTAIVFILFMIALELLMIVGFLYDDQEAKGDIAVVDVKGQIIESREIVDRIKTYREMDEVKAIVISVDSPGGAVGASQEIHDEIIKTKKKKPVVISMGNVAASGGYYIAIAGNRIIANPGTITGSIGVITQFFILENLLRKFNLSWEVIKSGPNKDIGSPLKRLSVSQRALLQGLIDDTYEQFAQAVAEGRNLPLEEVKKIADGRILSGKQALEAKLVDELGGLEHAIDVAAKLVGIKDKPKVIYPKEKSFSWLKNLSEGKIDLAPELQVQYRLGL